jgi:hypothetical protein
LKGVTFSVHTQGGTMHNPLEVDAEVRRMLGELGAEPLAGSGFENEQLEPEFQTESGLAEEA